MTAMLIVGLILGAVLLGAIVGVLVGGAIAIAAIFVRGRHEESGLGHEDVAAILGYQPSAWPMNGGVDRPEEPAA
jgi:hypothetical protein